MAMAIKIDEAVGCYFVRWAGTVTAEEFQAYYRIVFAEPWFREGLNVIHDGRNAVIEFSRTDVLDSAHTYDMVASAFGDCRIAKLLTDAEETRLLQTFIGASAKAKGVVEIFDNYDDARAWVGLPEDYPDPFKDEW